jgi:pilus assembly protein CpaE
MMHGRHGRNGKIRVLIVDDLPETGQTIRQWLAQESDVQVVGTATDAHEGLALARRQRPDVVLMDLYMPDIDGIEATQIFNQELPSRVILMSVESSRKAMQYAMRAGARDFLTKPLVPGDLLRAVREAARLPETRDPSGSGVFEAPRGQRAQRLIAVCGTKGGVGRSVIATNLAVALAGFAGQVALVDANLESGDDHVLLNLVDTHNSIESLLGLSELDYDAIQQAIDPHETGLCLLRAPEHAERTSDYSFEFLSSVYVEMREHFDIVVVDVDSALTPAATAALLLADRIVIVTTLEITAINRVKRLIETLQQHDIPSDRLALVCNRYDGGYQIRPVQMERLLGRRFAVLLPDDVRTVVASVNRGEPLVLRYRRSPVAREIMRFAQRLHREVLAVQR